jgi:uncharacterized protein (TIGR02466 family)
MTIRIDIATRALFPTPVAAVQTPGYEARNLVLRAAILKRRAEAPSMQASNDGGWHSGRDIMEWGGAEVAEILDIARLVANRLTADREGKPVQPDWKISAWANVNGKGAGNFCHYHPGAFWSGTYYVDDGGCFADETLGGGFEMLDPRGPSPAMLAPTLAFAGEGGQSAGATETIRPRPGMLFMFPSWLQHQVRAYRGTRERISIAFNLRI